LGIITKAPQIWGIIKRNVSGDLGFMDLLRYSKYGLDLDMHSIHSHVFSNKELTSGKLESGAYVLLPKSATALTDVFDHIFEYIPINRQATHPKGCPPPPAWAADYLLSLTPTPPQ